MLVFIIVDQIIHFMEIFYCEIKTKGWIFDMQNYSNESLFAEYMPKFLLKAMNTSQKWKV